MAVISLSAGRRDPPRVVAPGANLWGEGSLDLTLGSGDRPKSACRQTSRSARPLDNEAVASVSVPGLKVGGDGEAGHRSLPDRSLPGACWTVPDQTVRRSHFRSPTKRSLHPPLASGRVSLPPLTASTPSSEGSPRGASWVPRGVATGGGRKTCGRCT